MRTVRWLGQTIDNACMQACNVQYGATSAKPDPAKLISCFVTQCSGSQTAPPTVVPPPGFTLPAGMTLPGGFTIPAGWTLPAGLPLPAGNLPGGTLPPGWTLPTSIIPPGFTLPQDWTLPTSWTLPGPLTLPTNVVVPAGVPVPPNLPTVPAPTPVTPAPAPAAEKKSDNTVLWVVGGLAAVAAVAVIAMSSKSIGGGMAENPRMHPKTVRLMSLIRARGEVTTAEVAKHFEISPESAQHMLLGAKEDGYVKESNRHQYALWSLAK